jgi:hypothetical protein
MGNAVARGSGQERFPTRLRQWAGEADEGLRAAAQWALGKLGMLEDQREN